MLGNNAKLYAKMAILIMVLPVGCFAIPDKTVTETNRTEQVEVTLKEYFDEKFEAQKAYFDSKIESMNTATTLARNAMEKRLEGLNEFRETLKDQASKFITRQEVESQLAKISEDIKMLRESKASMEGKASQNALIVTLLVATASLVIGVVSLFKKSK